MKNLIIFIYTLILINCIAFGEFWAILGAVLLGIILLIFASFYIKIKKKKIKNALNKPKEELKPFFNINKEQWYAFNELPGFNSVCAKKAVWLRKKLGKYKSLEDFYTKNNINQQNKEILNKILYL